MFLFAKLVMENLSQQARRVDLVRELEEDVFPKGLQNALVSFLKIAMERYKANDWLATRE
jgi:hypothetical protein